MGGRSQEHTGQTHNDSGVMHVSIDKSSQSGTFYDIGSDFDIAARTVGHRYTFGTLTLKGSPIPMNVTLAPLQLLME